MLINCISTNLILHHRAKKHVKQEANYLQILLTRSENTTEIEKIFIFLLQTLSYNWELFDGFFLSKMKFWSADELDVSFFASEIENIVFFVFGEFVQMVFLDL